MADFSESISWLRNLPENEVYDARVVDERIGGVEEATDDYAVRRVPATWRWTAWDSLWAISGISTALAIPLTGGLISVIYGGPAALTAIFLLTVYAAIGVRFTARKAANEGALAELISKHTFGFKGAAFQIAIYGILGIVYFSLEGHVLSAALSETLPIPYAISAALICLMFVPLTLYGMQFLTRFQALTIWIYALGMGAVLYGLFSGWSSEVSSALAPADWWNVNPNNVPYDWQSTLGAFGVISGLDGAILILLIPATARFTRRDQANKTGILMALGGIVFSFGIAMPFGVYLLATTGGKIPDPGVSIPRLLGSAGLFLVILTQLRVNVINVYFGTTAMENFAAQIFRKKWTRAKFLIPFMIAAYLLVISPFLQYFGTIMTMLSVFLICWASVILGELWLVRGSIGLPQWSEFRRGYAASYNTIGMISMWPPTAIGIVMGSGLFGKSAQALAVPLSGAAAFLLPKICSLVMSEAGILRQYFGRVPARVDSLSEVHRCELCGGDFHRSDFVLCPYHKSTYICSACCTTEQRCDLMCHVATRAA